MEDLEWLLSGAEFKRVVVRSKERNSGPFSLEAMHDVYIER